MDLNRPAVIAYRKACRATGVGLSHYVLLTTTPPHANVSPTDEREPDHTTPQHRFTGSGAAMPDALSGSKELLTEQQHG